MSFKAVLEADIKGFSNNIDKAISDVDRLEKTTLQKLSKVGDSFISIGKKASIFSAAVGAAAVAAVAFAKKTGDMANDLLSATIALDSSADILQEYKLVSIEAGTSTDAFARSVEALTRRLKEAEGDGNDVTEYIQRLGVSLFDSSGEMRRMGDITDDLIKSLAGMENIAQRNIIASQLFGRQWVSIAPILALGADGIDEVRRNAHDLGVVLDGDALNAANKFSIEMNKMQLQLQAVKDRLASEIAPVLSETLVPILEDKVVPAIGKMADGLGDIADKFNNLPDQTKEVILAIGGIAVAIGPVLLGIGAILKTLPLIAAGFAALSGPIVAIGAVMVTAVVNFGKNIEALKTDWDYLLNHLRTTSAGIGDVLSGNFSGWWEKVQSTWGKNIEYLKDKLRQLKEYFTGVDVEPAWYAANEMTGSAGAIQVVKKEVDDLNKSLGKTKDIAELDTFQKLIGEQLNVRDAITKTTATIEDLQSKLVKLQTGILPSTNVRQELAETQQQINDLSAALDLLTGKRELNIDVKTNISGLEAAENKFLKDGAIVVPPIDTSLLENSLGQAKEMVAITSQDLGSLLSTGISMFSQTIGDAFAGNWDGLGAGLLKAVGSLAQQFGGLIVGMGVAALELQTLITNPLTAIAAGAALIALGALASKAAQNMMSSATGGGGGYSSAPSLRNTGPSYGPSDYRGPYQDDFKVEFKIGTNELVGVLNTAEQRRNRI